ncbi:MAG TPA: flagellar filament capping protein FliD [Bryobacteraceae bacterium]|nr:flagellar filament capping protein FliD [Bryobacteraceae bacterium]
MSTSSTTSPSTGIVTATPDFVSQYASEYQTILNHAMQTAEIPLAQLQSEDSAVLSKESAFSTLNSSVASLVTSLQNLGTLAASQALGATSSDPSVVSVTDTGATTANTYTINSIKSIASAASETSTTGYADTTTTAVSQTGQMQLVVGSNTYNLDLTGNNNLQGLENAINASGAPVTASILTTSGGNYLSVTADATGATTLQLYDGATASGTDVLTDTNQGSDAVFQLNGIKVDQSSNTVNNIIPGLTFTLLAPSATPVTMSLQTDPSQLSSDLQDFVTQYNALQTEIGTQTGTSGGPLAGQTVLNQIQETLRQLTSYTTTTGTVQSLADLGIEFSDTGVASFSSTTFDSLGSQQISDALTYIGSTTSGLGGFSATLDQFSDPVSGLIQDEVTGLQKTDTDLQTQASTVTTQIETMQTNLVSQLAAADAAEETLQNQQQELSGSLQALSLVLYGPGQTNF